MNNVLNEIILRNCNFDEIKYYKFIINNLFKNIIYISEYIYKNLSILHNIYKKKKNNMSQYLYNI